MKKIGLDQFVRIPKSSEEARDQVHALKLRGVDGIKAVLEAGVAGHLYNRLDIDFLKAIAQQSRVDSLPIVVHTGDSHDVQDALAVGINGVEHGSMRDRIPNEVFAAMAKSGVAYDPTLSVAEAFLAIAEGTTDLLDRSLVAQAVPNKLLQNTKKMINSPQMAGLRESIKSYPIRMDVARDNLVRAWKAGVMLVTGSDAGNMLVLHGPTVQHELQLWVEAGIPASVALQAATNNAAKLLRIENRVGLIRNGYDATLLLVDGNPLQDISATERISIVFYKGERVDRGSLFDQ
jgi:imidazolonepropionase-like amidohydrolase